MMIFNIFGRYLGVKRENYRWLVFRVDLTEQKFSRLYDIVIPNDITEKDISGWISDIFHESATIRNPDVTRIE